MTAGRTRAAGVLRGIGQLVIGAAANGGLEVVGHAALAWDALGRVCYAGPAAALERSVWLPRGGAVEEAGGALVTAGLVDCHTHLVFAGDRAAEFHERLAGVTYAELLRQGRGIRTTVSATRAASLESLVASARPRLRRALQHGTTTCEVKSGYGMEAESEHRMLQAVATLAATQPVHLEATFLGLHVVPAEFKGRADDYVRAASSWAAGLARAGLARHADAWCDRGVFTPQQCRDFLNACRQAGLLLRLHADELGEGGGGNLAAELGVRSADHCDHTPPQTWPELARAGVTVVLLPGVNQSLGGRTWPDARAMRDQGLRVALATDCNPGTSYCENLQAMWPYALHQLGLDLAECLLASTRWPALSLDLPDRGALAPGCRADYVVWAAETPAELGYHFGVNLAERVAVGGLEAWAR